MRSSTVAVAVLFLAVAAASFVQIGRVYRNRFDLGDVYAPYSTFRSDPQGMSALFAALDALPGITATRSIEDVSEMEPGKRTLVIASAQRGPDPVEIVDALDRLVAEGGTIVVAFNIPNIEWADEEEVPAEEGEESYPEPGAEVPAPPAGADPLPLDEDRSRQEEARERREAEERRHERIEDLRKRAFADIEDRWGFDIDMRPLPEPESHKLPAVRVNRSEEADPNLPATMDWRSPGYFDALDEAWRTVYARDDLPVLIERRYPGGGSIVLATDHYFLSNEALREDRQSGLLAWMLARQPEVVFDETHLGTQRPTFIMSLIRRYRLHGVLAAFVVLAILYIWKNTSTLVPREAAVEEDERLRTSLGKDTSAALVHLLRRTVPPRDLLRTCYAEWRHSAPKDPATLRAAEEMARLVEGASQISETALPHRYRELCGILARRRAGAPDE